MILTFDHPNVSSSFYLLNLTSRAGPQVVAGLLRRGISMLRQLGLLKDCLSSWLTGLESSSLSSLSNYVNVVKFIPICYTGKVVLIPTK